MKAIFFLILFISVDLFAARDCIDEDFRMTFRQPTSRSVILENFSGPHLVEVFICFELPWARKIAFDTFFSRRICESDDLLVIDPFDNRIIDRCRIDRIKKL